MSLSLVSDDVRTPTLLECVRQEIDCICGVHGYALYAEFDYHCDTCGNSDNAEFYGNPMTSKAESKKPRRVHPDKVQPGRKESSGFMSSFFARSYRPRSAP